MDIDQQTSNALDWPAVLLALSERARTPMGRRRALDLAPSSDPATIHTLLDQTDEVLRLEGDGGWVPVGGIEDIAGPVDRSVRQAVLDKAELRLVGRSLEALNQLGAYLDGADADIPALRDLSPRLGVDPDVVDALVGAFDEAGELSARRYPVLGELRERVAGLHAAIRRTLDELVKGDGLADELQDRFVTQRGDRYVIPVKANYKRKELGIVHGMSSSGQTAFVEPHEVVALNNDLRLAEGELDAAERRILAQLSGALGRVGPSVLVALRVATEVDLACARAELARRLDAVRPRVGESSAVVLRNARHPLLVLRGLEVVPNDLELTTAAPILVVSGPNTGGKTVALKTIGLAALLVRIGCFVPADEGSRVDVFHDVIAIIGDHQTVHGDQSSFSSHVTGLREMLERSRPGCLFLVDEIASGTDPEQGAALAHAVLERFLERGVRALITTHFQRLKTLGATEPRIAVAGMQFARGRPTYRLVRGASGESHALEIAERIGVEAAIVARARAAMDEGERDLADALMALERERARAEDAQQRADALAVELRAQTERLAAREEALTRRASEIEQQRAAGFVDRLAAAEKAISAVVAELQKAPSQDRVRAARATVDALRSLAPAVGGPAAGPVALQVGDRVRLARYREVGEVLATGKQVQVKTSRGLTLRVDPHEVERLGGLQPAEDPKPQTAPKAPKAHKGSAPPSLDQAVRYDGNTLDLRGQRVDEGLEAVEAFLDQAILDDRQVVFILHGHGTGAMKVAVRKFLRTCRYVSAAQPAHADQGGDAFTVASLR